MQPRRTLILSASDHRELLDMVLLAWTHGALGLWETQQDVMKYFRQIDFGKMKKYAFFPPHSNVLNRNLCGPGYPWASQSFFFSPNEIWITQYNL